MQGCQPRQSSGELLGWDVSHPASGLGVFQGRALVNHPEVAIILTAPSQCDRLISAVDPGLWVRSQLLEQFVTDELLVGLFPTVSRSSRY